MILRAIASVDQLVSILSLELENRIAEKLALGTIKSFATAQNAKGLR